MNLKKLAIVGAIALVVIGCVIAAGCTSSSTTTQQTSSDDICVGTWYNEDTNRLFTLYADGTASGINDKGLTTFTWKVTNPGKIAVTYLSGKDDDGLSVANKTYDWTYDSKNDVITTSLELKYIRTSAIDNLTDEKSTSSDDSHVGTWYNEDTNRLFTLYADGTGFGINDKGLFTFTLKVADSGKITVTYLSGKDLDGSSIAGKTYDWTYDSKNDIFTSSKGTKYIRTSAIDNLTDEKSTSSDDICVGTWYNEDTNRLFTLYADGTASGINDKGLTTFTWKAGDSGKITVTYLSGKDDDGLSVANKTYDWTYDSKNDVITTSLELKYIRTSAIDNLAEKKSTSSDDSHVGTWYNEDTNRLFTLYADGTGFGINDKGLAAFTWKAGDSGKITVTYLSGIDEDGLSAAGQTCDWTYDSKNDVFTSYMGLKYIRTSAIDNLTDEKSSTSPIVGLWFCDTNDNGVKKAKVTTVLLADGTGYSFETMTDGTSAKYQATWKKNTDDTYDVNWSNGFKEIMTLNSAKDTLTTSENSKFVKKELNDVSKKILGIWYNKDNNIITAINADGTGSGINENGLFTFTWKVTDSGKITVTYVSGKNLDGSSVAGTSYELSYDSGNDVLTTPKGIKYIRPTETVKDRVTIH